MKRLIPILIIGAVLATAVSGGWYLKRSATRAETLDSQRQPRTQNKSKGTKRGAEPAHMRGPDDARVVIEEFADFECGACGVVHPIVKQIEKEFGSQIAVVFREYPLSMHRNGLTAAQAAESAGLQAKFWEMHDLLFENQKEWHQVVDVRSLYRGYASQAGVSVEKFERDMTNETVKTRISADNDRAASLGVNSTPTAFLNGREIPFETLTSVEKLRELIRAELSSAETKKP
jgi:protein-disulfide isomerase